MSKKVDKQTLSQQIQTVQNITKQLIQIENSPTDYMNEQQQKQIHKKLIQYLNRVIECLERCNAPYLVFLIGVDILKNIYQAVNVQQKHKDKLQKELNMQNQLILKIIQIAQNISPDFLQTFWKDYNIAKNILQQQKQKMQQNNKINKKLQQSKKIIQQSKKLQQNKKIIQQSEKIDNYKQFKKVLQLIIQTISQGKKNNRSLNYAYKTIIQYQQRQKRNDNIYQQSSLNWMKIQLNKLRKDKQFICCKTSFIHQQLFQCTNRKYFDFKSFTKLQDNPKINQQLQQISKSICSLMNNKGGIIFLGINNIQDKGFKVSGFELQDKNKKQLVKFIIKAINQVYPKHKGFQICSDQIQSYSTNQINHYINIQFINIIRRQTLQNYRDIFRPYQKLYICKIIIKIGHPRYLYYVLKNQGNKQNKQQAQIHFYIRREQGNQKQTLQKHYQLIYTKLIDYQKIKKGQRMYQRSVFHDGCRYDMSISQENVILENQKDDDDDDSDSGSDSDSGRDKESESDKNKNKMEQNNRDNDSN